MSSGSSAAGFDRVGRLAPLAKQFGLSESSGLQGELLASKASCVPCGWGVPGPFLIRLGFAVGTYGRRSSATVVAVSLLTSPSLRESVLSIGMTEECQKICLLSLPSPQ